MLNNSYKTLDGYILNLRKSGTLEEDTIEIYKNEIIDFIGFIGDISAVEVTRELALNYVEELKRNFTDTSVKRKIVSLNGFYKYLLKKDEIENNPFEGIKVKIEKKDIVKSKVELGELRAVLDFCPHDGKGRRDHLIINLMLNTSLKINDILDLKMDDILKDRNIEIPSKEGIFKIELTEELGNELEEYIKYSRNKIEEHNESLLFKELSRQNFRARFIKYCKLAGIEDEISPSEVKKLVKQINVDEESRKSSRLLDNIKEEYLKIGIGDD